MTALILGLGLAVLASVALNGSYLLQHAGSRAGPAVNVRRPLATLGALLRSRLWLAGAAAGAAGWALHVGALAHAPLSLVQAFAAGGLALTLPVAARAFGQRLARSEVIAVAVLVASLALLGLGAGAVAAGAIPVLALAVSVGLAGLGAGILAAVDAGPRRAHLLGAAGGMLYGAADAATKAVTMTHGGLLAAVLSPWTAVVVLTSVAAFACFQRGLQIGPAVPVIALMTGATNAVAILIGLVAFGESLGATAAFAALHVLAFVLAGAAGLVLAAAQGRVTPEQPPQAAAGIGAGERDCSSQIASAPSTNASPCSTPARPIAGGITTRKALIATTAASRVAPALRRSAAPASAPTAPAHTHETP
ncbi:MAG: hypothetical protein ABI611_05080 [Solirubrobacteraceae bacterium]